MSAPNGPRVLLLGCYELGHPPLGLAWPLAALREAGLDARAVDLAVQPFPAADAAAASLVLVSVAMHTALRLGVKAAARVRDLNPHAHVAFYGHYAWLNAQHLLSAHGDSVVAGEVEPVLVALARAILAGREPAEVPDVSVRGRLRRPHLNRVPLPVPDHSDELPLGRYAGYVQAGRTVPAGYVEASRGCKHLCRHCPVVPVYRGRFFAVPVATVLADARGQVAAGARHLTFGDPDFLNGPTHALRVARALHGEHPDLTFDFTAKVEHLLRHRSLLPELAALGCTFVVSAVESLSDRVLARLRKNHTAADVEEVLDVLDQAGVALHATLVAFTPWTTLDDYLAQLEFFRTRGLVRCVPPVQLSIRLLVPPGSALLEEPDTAEWLGELDPENFVHPWRHPDPRMDALYEHVAARVEEGESADEPAEETWEAVRALAFAAAGRPLPDEAMPPAFRPEPPRLTEHWFC